MSFFQDVINIVAKYYPQLLSGVGNTMLIALTGTVAGLAIGLLTGIVRTAPFSRNGFVRVLHKILNAVIAVYVEIFRGTPMMVQAMVIYWGYAFASGGNTLPLIPSGILIVSVNTGAYMAEIVRGGLASVPAGQYEAARSQGFSAPQMYLYIILPQALRNMVPALLSQFVTTIKDTSYLWGAMALQELMGRGMILMNSYNSTVQIFAIIGLMAIINYVVCFTLSQIVRAYQRRLKGAR